MPRKSFGLKYNSIKNSIYSAANLKIILSLTYFVPKGTVCKTSWKPLNISPSGSANRENKTPGYAEKFNAADNPKQKSAATERCFLPLSKATTKRLRQQPAVRRERLVAAAEGCVCVGRVCARAMSKPERLATLCSFSKYAQSWTSPFPFYLSAHPIL